MKLIKLSFLAIILGVTILNVSCKEDKKVTITPIEILFKKEGELKLYKSKTDSIIKALDIEIADNEYDRETGLMYRPSMKDQDAMLFIFPEETPRAFYMKNTQIALDIIYIGKDNTIVSIVKKAQPMNETSLLSYKPAMYVLEVNAGLSDKWQLKEGDSISFTK